jgi:hypothetical protein
MFAICGGEQHMQEVNSISLSELEAMAPRMYGELVKAVVDVEQRRVVVDADMHADEELFLLERGSNQHDLWGINLHPELWGSDDFIEFDSMINLRPGDGKRSRSVDDPAVRKQIRDIIAGVVHE